MPTKNYFMGTLVENSQDNKPSDGTNIFSPSSKSGRELEMHEEATDVSFILKIKGESHIKLVGHTSQQALLEKSKNEKDEKKKEDESQEQQDNQEESSGSLRPGSSSHS